jgi:hypothetical protein
MKEIEIKKQKNRKEGKKHEKAGGNKPDQPEFWPTAHLEESQTSIPSFSFLG